MVAAGRSVLGVLAIVGFLRAARLGADLNVTIFESLNGFDGERLRPCDAKSQNRELYKAASGL